MTQYNSLNVKSSNSQPNKFKSAIKKWNWSSFKIIIKYVTNRQVSNLRKSFANHLSADIKLSKTQLSKMIQSRGFLGRLLGPLLKTGLPLTKNAIKPLPKSALIPLRLTAAAAAAADAGIHKKY